MAAYGHVYSYMHHFDTQEVCETSSQHIYTQEAGACYTKLTHLWCSTTNFYAKGYSTSLATRTYGNTNE